MIIYIEGADGTGKTTLISQLTEYFEVIKSLKKDSTHVYDFLKYYNESDKIYVMDRGPLTDLVYRSLDLKKSYNLDIRQLGDLLYDACVVLCDTDSCFEDSLRRGEDNILTRQKSDYLRNAYKYAITLVKCFTPKFRTINYDWHKDTIEKIINFIKEET